MCVAGVAQKNTSTTKAIDNKSEAYVDMGLPSGTLWKVGNEFGMYDYEAATTRFEGKLPTYAQFRELWRKCKWVWLGNGYRVTGPNGNSIVLPTTGKRDCEGNESNFNLEGWYWSCTTVGDGAKRLFLSLGHVDLGKEKKCMGMCVRLVKNGK